MAQSKMEKIVGEDNARGLMIKACAHIAKYGKDEKLRLRPGDCGVHKKNRGGEYPAGLRGKELFTDIENLLIKKLQNGESTLEKVLLSATVCENSKFKKISNEILDLICENIEDIENLPEVKYLSSTFLEMLINDKRWVDVDSGDEESNRNEEKDKSNKGEGIESKGDNEGEND